LELYFFGFFGDLLPFLILYTFVSFFIHVMVNKKFVAYMLVFTFFIGSIALDQMGFSHSLYSFGGSSSGTYSQMNGYGHFLAPFLWTKTYWFIFCLILFIITTLFSVRGTETGLKYRWKQSKQNLSKPLVIFGAISISLFILVGSFIYYNTNILNEYWTDTEEMEYRVAYEQTLKQYEYLPQPKIIDVNLTVELYPATRNYTAEGYYMLINTQNKPINKVHIQKKADPQINLEYVTFEGGATEDDQFKQYGYYIYELNKSLEPGDSVKMNFKQSFITQGFKSGNSNTRIVNNGTFFDNNDFPSLGYNKKYELREDDNRKDFGLTQRAGMADRNNSNEIANGNSGGDGYKINFEIIIGTASDQTAIAPGALVKKWKENNRNYFHYKMKTPMINFYSIVSARYEVLQDTWTTETDSLKKHVNLEIYYHKGHEYNLDRMMDAMKMSFDYFSANFGPYQYEQMRIMEFPRYTEFAQSFPMTVPFSEAIGFMLDINDETDVDMVFYITAHELAHQWWGLQVVAANVQGRHLILETLAQYSALMVLKQKYSQEKIQQFLKSELDAYFVGKAKDDQEERPLALVEKEDYVYYRKGAVNMYTLQDYIGEANVNLALKRFINDWNAFDDDFNKKRVATTKDLLKYFREVTPIHLQYLLTDMFERVILYDNKLVNFKTTQLDSNSYKVDVNYTVTKYKTDINGNRLYSDHKMDSLVFQTETMKEPLSSLPLSDYIDVVIFGEEEIGGKKVSIEVYKKRHKITEISNNLSVIINQRPIEAGVDPYYRFIDKNTDDNRKRE